MRFKINCCNNNPITNIIVLFLGICHTTLAQLGSDGTGNSPSNYKDSLLIYPTGIRSERDLPICPGWTVENEEIQNEIGPSFSPIPAFGADINKLQPPQSTKHPSSDSSKKADPSKYLAACNIIHRRYFYPPMIERLCRCPDRTECPMEWSSPPLYRDLTRKKNNPEEKKGSKQTVSAKPSSNTVSEANNFDPYTVMISSRTQLKFCTEVSAVLPRCEKVAKSTKDSSGDEIPSMVKTIQKTLFSPELPSISVNCYCPPLYHGWKFLSKNLPSDFENGTTDANYFYTCDPLRRCKSSAQQCGSIRTDYHFSYYSCSCPKKHICVPKVYPPISIEDVVDDAEEALYSGQVSPAYCSPE